ncbi:MAG: prephenate dehydratase [Candidatus Omnitrophica bacterium 4484_70.1]|nr:MAG: prephenate dehydratase [Candidatus Omnitrophica bacterium 4484_70.1]
MPINSLRKKIDRIDNEIVRLLLERAEIVKKISVIKKRKNLDIFSPEREKKILERLKKVSSSILKESDIELIFKEIFSVFRSLEANLSVAYLGPQGTFTHLAAVKKFGKKMEYYPCESINEVFEMVDKGSADFGVVPIENSIEGVVNHTLDMFLDSSLKICAEILLDIHHDLLASRSLKKVKRIYSHPQVFAQCRNWLNKNLKDAEFVSCASTASAALRVKEDIHGACIGSRILASLYNLKILAKNIQDVSFNLTRFLVIAKKDSVPSGKDKTSLLFSIKDKVGALHDALYSFKRYRINLTKIESRPSKRKAWEYYFFVDFEGHRLDKNVERSLKELEKRCNFVKILGSYPKES